MSKAWEGEGEVEHSLHWMKAWREILMSVPSLDDKRPWHF